MADNNSKLKCNKVHEILLVPAMSNNTAWSITGTLKIRTHIKIKYNKIFDGVLILHSNNIGQLFNWFQTYSY